MANSNGKQLARYFKDSLFSIGMKDQQVDQCLSEELNKLWNRALQKCDLDQEMCVARPVMIVGFPQGESARAELVFKKGKDKKIRWMPLGVLIINFTENQLVTYECDLNPVLSKPLSEKTKEFHYRQIVSMDTESSTRTETTKRWLRKDKVDYINDSEKFVLVNKSGQKVTITLREESIIAELGGGEIDSKLSEQSIKAVRKMVREKQN